MLAILPLTSPAVVFAQLYAQERGINSLCALRARIRVRCAVFKRASCHFLVPSKMGKVGRVPYVELYPCVGERQNWSRLNPCRRGSKEFQHATVFPLTEELMAGTDS